MIARISLRFSVPRFVELFGEAGQMLLANLVIDSQIGVIARQIRCFERDTYFICVWAERGIIIHLNSAKFGADISDTILSRRFRNSFYFRICLSHAYNRIMKRASNRTENRQ